MQNRPNGWKYEPQLIKGKSIVLTGGTTGIGRTTAQLLAYKGARVLIFGRHEKELNDALRDCEKYGEVEGMLADQAHESDVMKVFERVDTKFGSIDILINNAAIGGSDIEESSLSDITYIVHSNLLGYLYCAHEAVKRMREKRNGHIVNVGSLSAEVRDRGSGVYVATKAGIRAWSTSLSKTVVDYNIKVSLIESGNVGTDLRGYESAEYQQEQERKMAMLTTEDIAESILYCIMQPLPCDITDLKIRPHRQPI